MAEDAPKQQKKNTRPRRKRRSRKTTSAPVIIERQNHSISRKNICPNALKVLYRLKQAGYIAYLVGGGVRDMLMDRDPKDYDISTSAHPEEIKALFKNCWLIGRRFRLAHIKYGNSTIETSTFRKTPENNNEDEKLLVKDDNTFGTPEQDAMRRDFTINGLFYNIEDFSIIDYVGGIDDLQKKLIRSIGDPNIRFQEDPVRMLRAIRFASRLNFHIEDNTFKAIIKHAPEITHSSQARIYEEFLRLFAYGSGEKAMRLLVKTNLLEHILPNLNAYITSLDGEGKKDYFKYLELLDKDTTPANESPDSAIVMATVIYPAIRAALSNSTKKTQAIHIIRNSSHNFWQGLVIPRKLRDFIRQSFISIERIEEKTRRRVNKNRFMSRSCFKNALKLFYFTTEVENSGKEKLTRWYELYRENQERRKKKKKQNTIKDEQAHDIQEIELALENNVKEEPKDKKTVIPEITETTKKSKPVQKENINTPKESGNSNAGFIKPKTRSSARILISTGSKHLAEQEPHWLDEI